MGKLPYMLPAVRTACLILVVFWLGGFTFYSSVVIPIGTDELGSAAAQGMVTRRVAFWLNVISDLAALAIIASAWLDSSMGTRRRTLLAGCGLLVGGCSLVQWWVYPKMMGLIAVEEIAVLDPPRFYGLHRIYLWSAAFKWLAALVWLMTWSRMGRSPDARRIDVAGL